MGLEDLHTKIFVLKNAQLFARFTVISFIRVIRVNKGKKANVISFTKLEISNKLFESIIFVC